MTPDFENLNVADAAWEEMVLAYGLRKYLENVVPRLKEEDDGKIILIDLHSGIYEICRGKRFGVRLLKRRAPSPLIWTGRIALSAPEGLSEIGIEVRRRDWRSARPIPPPI